MRKLAAHYIIPIGSKPIKNGYIKVDDNGVIVEIGELNGECESTEFFNGILCPGFVNTHCHIELSHLKGHFTEDSGMAGFIKQINLLRLSVGEEERRAAITTEMEKLYREGVSAMADISNGSESFPIKAKSPIYTRTFLEVFGTEIADKEQIIADVLELQTIAQSYQLDAAPTPHSCYTMHPSLLSDISNIAIENGYLSYHSQESWEEEAMIKSGKGPLYSDYIARKMSTPPITGESALKYFIDRVAQKRELPIEENILLVHNTVTDHESILAAKEAFKNLYMAICPLSNLFIHRALPPLDLMIKENITITLGTDSLSSNKLLSMIEEMKCIQQYFPHIEFTEILKWATLNGAKFLNRDKELGTFEPGKQSGVILIENINWEEFKLTKDSISTRII